MTLETIYYIGQTLAVAVILLSVAFVGYQTRQTNRLARTELTRSLLSETRVYGDAISTSPEMAEFMFKSLSATEQLPPQDFFRLGMYFASWFTALESAYKVNTQKLIEPSVYEHIRVTTRVMDCVNMRIWWQNARSFFAPDFAADVDGALRQWDAGRQ